MTSFQAHIIDLQGMVYLITTSTIMHFFVILNVRNASLQQHGLAIEPHYFHLIGLVLPNNLFFLCYFFLKIYFYFFLSFLHIVFLIIP
jgi:hypothetical protein